MTAFRLFLGSIGLGLWALFYWQVVRHIPTPKGLEFFDKILGVCFLIAIIGCPYTFICGVLSLLL